ncbi:predicted protein [Nematostella vectensis]|uniref:Polyprenal reductase n=1 Tax=Nematostella vectensis TaxID=45351 RepID=A7S1V1_NEMVE|nr:predicted protein [Nematostella vectensis]|eukprot:XP_001634326.1 predicted protein [Nematostella vectensis]
MPNLLKDLFKYGKTDLSSKARRQTVAYRLLHVPKRWFTHFYLVGLLWCIFLCWDTCVFCHHGSDASWVVKHLYFLSAPGDPWMDDITSLAVTLGMFFIQVLRRLLECLFMSNMTGNIHVLHYVAGILFYILVGLSLVLPYFISPQGKCLVPPYSLQHPKWFHLPSLVLFTWSSFHQFKCHHIFYKLRDDSQLTSIHKVPYGDWFTFVSSPHYLAEILIYMSFIMVHGGRNPYTWLMLGFVVQNLCLGATANHHWYKAKFKSYPKSRYRIFPFLY